jgi:hypothetical protein
LNGFRQNSAQAVRVGVQEIIRCDAMSRLSILTLVLLLTAACTPTVKVEAPDKPIEINMNINIKHEILIKIEKDVEALLDDDMF